MERATSDRRRQGRPVGDKGRVGRDALIDAGVRLLKDQVPSRLTISNIAREAGADPALVRYYFGTRAALLAEIVDRLMGDRLPYLAEQDAAPIEAFERRVRSTFSFTRSARYMHRLMLEELVESDGADGRHKLRDLNLELIAEYKAMKDRDKDNELIDFDPLFLNLTVLAVSDFFCSAAPLLEQLAPEADPAELAERYQAFVVKLLVDGLRRR